MRILILCWFLMAGLAFADDAALNTNDVAVAEAVEAMTVVEVKKTTAEDAAAEAVEVAEIVKRTEAEEEAKPKKVIDPWDAFYPPSDTDFDWIQLTSGEWLKGNFKVLYDYKLEFDSDELDLLEFDFEDVKQLRTRRMQTVFMQGDGGRRDTDILRGMLEIKGDEVILRRSEQDLVIPRSHVISIADGRQRERDYWSGMVSIGINARAGNTDTMDITSMANIKRRTAATRFAADYISNYSESGDAETANNQRLNGNYDRFMTAKFYWQVLSGEYFRDPFTNIDGQYSLSTGLGYDIIHTSKTEWLLGAGVGYQEQKFLSVEVGKEDSSTSPFGTFGTRFEHEVTGNLDFVYDYSMRLLNDDNGQYTHHMLTKFSFDVVKDLDLDISVIWDRIEKPQARTDGSVPEQDDYQLIVSLAYDF